MKEFLRFALLQRPALYAKILESRGKLNLEMQVFLSLLKKGDVVFDVGANHGHYTLTFSHLVGKGGAVHAFEPVPITFETLSQSLTANARYHNVHLNNCAVGETNGTVTLYMPDNDTGQASMTTHDIGSWQDATTVTPYDCELLRLDHYVQMQGITRLDFVKIDIEGAELPALKGFSHTLSRLRPVIHLEVCPEWTKDFGYQPVDVLQYLATLGYTDFYLVDDHMRQVREPDVELSSGRLGATTNLVCLTAGCHTKQAQSLNELAG